MPEQDTKPALYKLGTKIYRIVQIIVTCVLLAALIYGWQWLSDPAEFPIRAVKIQSTYEHIDQQTLKAEILPYVNQGFIRLRANALKKDLLNIPWVADVKVERLWPDTLVINVSEQQATARFGQEGLVNEKGQVFAAPTGAISEGLPVLNGPPDQVAALWTNYQTMSEMLKPLGLNIHELDIDDRLSLKMILTNGTTILLGKTDPLPRLQRFVKVYPNIFTPNKPQAEYIDLRYENGAAINWRSANPKPTAPATSGTTNQ